VLTVPGLCRSPGGVEEQAYLSWQGATLLVVKKDASLGLYAWNVSELVDVDTQEARWQSSRDARDELDEILLMAERVQPTLVAACAAFLRSAAKDVAASEEAERSESETKRLDCQIVLLRNDIRAALTPTPLKKKGAGAADRTLHTATPAEPGARTARTLCLGDTPNPPPAAAPALSPATEEDGSAACAIDTPGSIFGDWVGGGVTGDPLLGTLVLSALMLLSCSVLSSVRSGRFLPVCVKRPVPIEGALLHFKRALVTCVERSCRDPNPRPYTLDPTPSTLHPRPSTLHPRPYTRDPTPATLHPRPQSSTPTLDPTPSTLVTYTKGSVPRRRVEASRAEQSSVE
jgi:hypothetical protein